MAFATRLIVFLPLLLALAFPIRVEASGSFVNWETPHVHPLDMTPDGTKLLAVNTADNRLMVFALTSGLPVLAASIPVGLDPVSVRARTNTEAWVVNHISDSVSVVDLTTLNVVRTLRTDDEPADVVFAGTPQRAFISCSQVNRVMVVDPLVSSPVPVRISLLGEEPRALAVSPDGTKVYAAIFESGNGSTVLGGGNVNPSSARTNPVSSTSSPYGGVNPPPNAGAGFSPALNPANPPPPAVGIIVKKNAQGLWMDDNLGDWTSFVSGANSAASGRVPGWDLPDNDVAIIQVSTLSVSYVRRLMNLNMALSVHPSGKVTVVGTDATNERRFEPNLNGRFLRVMLALVDPSNPGAPGLTDLNPHADYTVSTLPQWKRDLSIGDPRGIAWNADGTRGYITGMGSNNVVVVNHLGARVARMSVGEGPTGVVVDGARGRLYVLNKFGASLSVANLSSHVEQARISFFDPSPAPIKVGRKYLYNTRDYSGQGHIACGSCHVDGRMDRLAWDLGDPSGTMESPTGQNLGMGIPGLTGGFEDWHPMKGPMVTQTLQDIIGKEPFHWRGDRAGLEAFNPAFIGLQGNDTALPAPEMQQFEDFLATLTFPPNPFRNIDNTLPTQLPLPGHYTPGVFSPAGTPLPHGNAVNGLAIFRPPRLLGNNGIACNTCHALPTGQASGMTWNGTQFVSLPAGPQGEQHHGFVSVDANTHVTMKVPQLRNLYKKVGMEFTQTSNLSGFGFMHDGSVDSLARFIAQPGFTLASDQEVADLVALMLALSGSELPVASGTSVLEPPGTASRDTHAAVGWQLTLDSPLLSTSQQSLLNTFFSLADAGKVGLVVKGRQAGLQRGYTYVGSGTFQSDRAMETPSAAALQLLAGPGSELTYTVVPKHTEWRIGVDRDEDGLLDRDELDNGSRPDGP
jgi:YVTN family beta-propeller protein